jgi:hypothetical protein
MTSAPTTITCARQDHDLDVEGLSQTIVTVALPPANGLTPSEVYSGLAFVYPKTLTSATSRPLIYKTQTSLKRLIQGWSLVS